MPAAIVSRALLRYPRAMTAVAAPPLSSRLVVLPSGEGLRVEALFAAEPRARFAPHWHPEWSVGAILEGHCEFTCDGEALVAHAGELVLMAPYMLHTAGVSRRSFRMVMLYVPHGWVAARLDWPEDSRGALLCKVLPDAALAEALAAAATAGDGAGIAHLVERILRAQTGPERVPLQPPAPDARVAEICALLAEEDACRIDPAALARRMGVSREHFQRAFREAVGMTPAHYARHARIGRAKALLREGVAPKDVAAECGFADQAHFSRWFRRCFGVAPGRYRVAA